MSVKWYGVQFEQHVAKNSMKILTQLGAWIKKRAKIYCPVKTGKLRDSIFHKIDFIHHNISIGFPRETYYGVFQELGTKYIRPKYFLRRALKEGFRKLRSGVWNKK